MGSAVRIEDASGFEGWADRVIVPETEEQVREVLSEAVQTATPVTILGSRTGLTGSCVPQGGWAVSLERFRKLEIEDGVAHVGPAVTLLELRDAAAETGQFYAPDPQGSSRR